MADNTELAVGAGGDTLRTEEKLSLSAKVPVTLIDVAGTANSESIIGDVGVYMPVDIVEMGSVVIAMGTGVRSAGTQRVTIATDDIVPTSQSGTWNVGTVTTVTTVAAVTGITNALPAGTNNIGDVDVLTVIPGVGATNLGKAIDTAAGATDTGVAVLAIRDDALTGLTPIEGDYSPVRVDANGAMWVIPSGTVTVAGAVTNAGTFVVQENGAALTALQLIDNAVAGAGFNITQFGGAAVPIGAGTEATAVRVTLPTDGTGKVSAAQSGTWNVGTVTGVTTVSTVTNLSQMGGVAISLNTGVRDTGTQRVTIATNDVVPIAITAAQTLATVTTLTTCSTLTGSAIAHDGVDSGNPHKIGAKAAATLSTKTLVAADDRTDLFAGMDGVLLTRSHCLGDVVQERATNTDGASTAFTSGLASPGAGIRLWIRNVTISNSSATFRTVDLRDGAAGAVLWTLPVPATGGVTMHFDPPLKLTAATALAYDASAATTTITISANGFKSKV